MIMSLIEKPLVAQFAKTKNNCVIIKPTTIIKLV